MMVLERPTAAGIEVVDLSKSFGHGGRAVEALDTVNLRIAPGEFLSVVGPSGCGKSTILRILAGLDAPDSGHALMGGEAPETVRRAHRIGVAFQDSALLPWRTVEQNIQLPLAVGRPGAGREEVRSLVRLVGLEGFERSRPAQLSGGMRQRVSIARALIGGPSVLLLDEPFGALDDMTRQRLNFELQRLWLETRPTTFMVTHGIGEATLLSDRVAVMAAGPGRIIEVVDIDLPRPRTLETMRSSRFQELQAHLSELLFAGQA